MLFFSGLHLLPFPLQYPYPLFFHRIQHSDCHTLVDVNVYSRPYGRQSHTTHTYRSPAANSLALLQRQEHVDVGESDNGDLDVTTTCHPPNDAQNSRGSNGRHDNTAVTRGRSFVVTDYPNHKLSKVLDRSQQHSTPLPPHSPRTPMGEQNIVTRFLGLRLLGASAALFDVDSRMTEQSGPTNPIAIQDKTLYVAPYLYHPEQ
jgi:hypothetical protein